MNEIVNPTTGELLACALQSPEIGKIAEALAKAQGEMEQLTATRTAKIPTKDGGGYSYKYADLSDVLSVARKALSKNGIAIVQSYEIGVPLILNTTMLHTSGEWLKSSLPVFITQTTRPQEIGSLMTYMRRYALSSMVGLAAEEDDDGKAAQGAQPPQQPKAAAKTDPKLITEAQCQLLYATCAQQGVTSATAKKYLTEKYKVGAAKDIKKTDFDAILKWVKEQKKASAEAPPAEGGENA